MKRRPVLAPIVDFEENIYSTKNSTWSIEEKKQLINLVKKNPLEPDFNTIGELLGKSEHSAKSTYMELVEPEKRVELCIKYSDIESITNIVKSLEHTCSECRTIFYNKPLIWKNNEVCNSCYKKYKLITDKMWQDIRDYCKENSKNKCNICSININMSSDEYDRFHFDHINMFDKENTIFTMVREGYDLIDIYKEIDKCQVVCISCHSVITALERAYGCSQLKTHFTKTYKNDSDTHTSKVNEYKSISESIMSKIYNITKKLILKSK
jgi:hypothetical protein